MDKKYDKAKEKLKQYKQEHLLIWYDKLIEQKREELLNQILKIDFETKKNILMKKINIHNVNKILKIVPLNQSRIWIKKNYPKKNEMVLKEKE